MHKHPDELQPRWSGARSQSVSTLRRMTGEMERLAPEHPVQSPEPSGKLWIFIIPFVLLILLSLLLIQHATYEKQIETKGAPVIDRQIVGLMDQSVCERTCGPSLRPSALAAERRLPAGNSHPFASNPYADQQIHLADQLAVLGKLDGSAAALLSAVDSHPADVELRMAAIRARMRIRDYSGAKNLAGVGLQLASNQKDRVLFEQLLKDIPSR